MGLWCRLKQLNLGTILKYTTRNASGSLKPECFVISSEVKNCLEHQQPVVALESTIITHGMPYPTNMQTTMEVENIIRKNGATPATIAVLNGNIHVGLNNQQLQYLAEGTVPVYKISRRDLAVAVGKKFNGGTTVSATMLIAHRTGIPIFVTGGIGGVHREAETTFDISTDLTELGRTPVTVVSAGVKSILDIGLSLEYLETQGVTVISFGETKEFPAFFSRKSGFYSPYNTTDVKEMASIIDANHKLNLESGILLAVPIPEDHSVNENDMKEIIQLSLVKAKKEGIRGKDITPFILQKVSELTSGTSLIANIALIKNNAEIGSKVAVALAELRSKPNKKCGNSSPGPKIPSNTTAFPTRNIKKDSYRKPVVIGGSVVDFLMTVDQESLKRDGSTHKGRIQQVFGGVARNICEALQRLGHDPLFLTALGKDSFAKFIMDRFPTSLDESGIKYVKEGRTATYCAVLDPRGECLFGVGDMDVHRKIDLQHIDKHKSAIIDAPIVIMDGNAPTETIEHVLQLCQSHQVPVWFEPTDINKAGKPFLSKEKWKSVQYMSPNLRELFQMYSLVNTNGDQSDILKTIENGDMLDDSLVLKVSMHMAKSVLNYVKTLVITLGPKGVFVVNNVDENSPDFQTTGIKRISGIHYPPLEPNGIISVSGSGDCLAAAVVCGILKGINRNACILSGLKAALLSLSSHFTVPEELDESKVFLQKSPANWNPQVIFND